MVSFKASFKPKGKELTTAFIGRLTEKRIGDVTAVSIDGHIRGVLDPDCAATVDIRIDDLDCWMADYRHSEFWCRPAFGTDPSEIPGETQGLLYRKKDGRYGVILPVVSEQYKCVLQGGADGAVVARLFSLCDTLSACRGLAFVYGEGDNVFELLRLCTDAALAELGNGCRSRENRRYPEIFEYLGWCSWDAMEIRVCEDMLLQKCRELRDKDIPVKWMILDDMWAEVHDFYDQPYKDRSEMFPIMHSARLFSFRADPPRFPNELKGCIDKIKAYGFEVGMWHPITGYWMGVDPDGDICRDHADLLIRTPEGRLVPDCDQAKAYLFFNAFHDYLAQSGATFVKIDNQSTLPRHYRGRAPIGSVARQVHGAMEASVGQHFDNQLINCMGMANEDMWNRSVSPISRCSDDFQPDDRAWFSKHIMQCSYNDLIQGQLYYCDWDMWWTDDGQALKNSVLRAVSGGPIYVSDQLERSRRDILAPLALSDGRILRCDRPAMPAVESIFENPLVSGKPFKLQNVCGDSGVLAAFNLDEANKPVAGTVSPSEIDGLRGETFAVYEYFSRELQILKYDESFSLRLENADAFKLYLVVPIVDGFAPIGRTDKFIAPKTVRSVSGRDVTLVEDGEYACVEDGKLVIHRP